jgi:hypothetical protein
VRSGQHDGRFMGRLYRHRAGKRAERHGAARMSAQRETNSPPGRLSRLCQHASQRRLAHPAVADQRDALKLAIVERRQRPAELHLPRHYGPRPAIFPLHRTMYLQVLTRLHQAPSVSRVLSSFARVKPYIPGGPATVIGK